MVFVKLFLEASTTAVATITKTTTANTSANTTLTTATTKTTTAHTTGIITKTTTTGEFKLKAFIERKGDSSNSNLDSVMRNLQYYIQSKTMTKQANK